MTSYPEPIRSYPCRMHTLRHVQEMLGGVSRATIYRWIASEQFPKPVKVCGTNLWPDEVLAEWHKNKFGEGEL